MENTSAYYIKKLKEGLGDKQRTNPQYSMRAYARDLGMHPATLNKVFKGTRPLPIKNTDQILDRLTLSPKERSLFIESLLKTKTSLDKIKVNEEDERFLLDESYYKVLAEWEHYTLLSLFDLSKPPRNALEVSKRLKVSLHRAQVVIDNLMVSGLLKEVDGKMVKVPFQVRTTEDLSSQALRVSHKETLDIAKQKLEEVELLLRDYSAMTIALDLEKLPEAKTIIREFRQKMAALLRDGNKTEVYQLAIQFFPLTETIKDGTEN